jgi:hypothetical protein
MTNWRVVFAQVSSQFMLLTEIGSSLAGSIGLQKQAGFGTSAI